MSSWTRILPACVRWASRCCSLIIRRQSSCGLIAITVDVWSVSLDEHKLPQQAMEDSDWSIGPSWGDACMTDISSSKVIMEDSDWSIGSSWGDACKKDISSSKVIEASESSSFLDLSFSFIIDDSDTGGFLLEWVNRIEDPRFLETDPNINQYERGLGSDGAAGFGLPKRPKIVNSPCTFTLFFQTHADMKKNLFRVCWIIYYLCPGMTLMTMTFTNDLDNPENESCRPLYHTVL